MEMKKEIDRVVRNNMPCYNLDIKTLVQELYELMFDPDRPIGYKVEVEGAYVKMKVDGGWLYKFLDEDNNPKSDEWAFVPEIVH